MGNMSMHDYLISPTDFLKIKIYKNRIWKIPLTTEENFWARSDPTHLQRLSGGILSCTSERSGEITALSISPVICLFICITVLELKTHMYVAMLSFEPCFITIP